MSKNMDIYAELDDFVEENEGQVILTDVTKHFAEYGYQYAFEEVCGWLRETLYETENKDGYQHCLSCFDSIEETIRDLYKAMEDKI